jgi:3-oxoadipyl-CoA thiolase
MEAVAMAARTIRSGEAELVIAGGVESMSRAPFVMAKADAAFSRAAKLEDSTLGWRFINPAMKERYGVDSMAETGENVAEEFHISRADQDWFAYRSQQRAAAAIKSGAMAEEIFAVTVPQRKRAAVVVVEDEHPRAETTMEGLAALKPIVKPTGTITPGNAAGINDGACALLLASEGAAEKYGLTPKARVITSAVAGVAPRIMGIGPVPASRKALQRTGLSIRDMDVIELNEAFASQALAVLRQLDVPDGSPKVNPNGGAIALGHPLGASGGRLVTTAMYQLQRTKGRYALCTMCIGVGQGIAMILERV